MNTANDTVALRAVTPAQVARPTEPAQYLTFILSGETFAIGILAIKEIIEHQALTTVPMVPECVRGVINLRGAVVPVMDLQARFGRPSSPVTKRTCIVIVEVQAIGVSGPEPQVIGVLVDVVNEVIEIGPQDIEPAPAFGARIRTDFMQGMARVKGRFVILLDVNQVFSLDDITQLSALAPEGLVA